MCLYYGNKHPSLIWKLARFYMWLYNVSKGNVYFIYQIFRNWTNFIWILTFASFKWKMWPLVFKEQIWFLFNLIFLLFSPEALLNSGTINFNLFCQWAYNASIGWNHRRIHAIYNIYLCLNILIYSKMLQWKFCIENVSNICSWLLFSLYYITIILHTTNYTDYYRQLFY